MTVQYAVLKGRVVGSVRAEVMEQRVNAAHLGNGQYRSNHFHLLVQAADGLWRCPVNVRSQDGSEVWFKIRDSLRDHPTPPPAPETFPVRIIAALVNPEGDDVGCETVTLFNTSTTPSELVGWKLMDRQNKTEALPKLRLGACESVTVRLRGTGVQLSNRGGALRLMNAKNELVHVVTYSQAHAVSGRVLVF